MFEIGFSEIVVIMLVALVVIGPERMPKVARTLGHLWGRMQRYVNQVKTDVTRSMEIEELDELKRQAEAEAKALQSSMQDVGRDLNREAQQLKNELEPAAPEAAKPAATDPAPVPLKTP